MRLLKLAVVTVAALAFGNAYAFHDGGVAYCDGCHVMHNASNGLSVTTQSGQPQRSNKTNPFLLQGADQSSTCLICHGEAKTSPSSYHIFTPGTLAAGTAPTQMTPGGDFAWLTKTYTWSSWSGSATSKGEKHGHSIIAAGFGLTTIDNNRAPGGAYMTGTGIAAFACSSCHDPHGRYRLQGDPANPVIRGPSANDVMINPIVASGSYPLDTSKVNLTTEAVGVYRILGGKNYRPFSNPGFPFQNDPPVAVAPSTYNQNEGTAGEVRVAYGKGMSEWCQNCHTYIHLDNYATGANGLVHPAGNGAQLRQLQADIYNKYKSSGDLTGSYQYTSLVPFESQTTSLLALGAAVSNTAPVGSPVAQNSIFAAVPNQTNVMCLSCHRAHASGFENMVRWNPVFEYLAFDTYPGTDATGDAAAATAAQGRTKAEYQAAYYGRTVAKGTGIAPFQRSLCNKCHAKD